MQAYIDVTVILLPVAYLLTAGVYGAVFFQRNERAERVAALDLRPPEIPFVPNNTTKIAGYVSTLHPEDSVLQAYGEFGFDTSGFSELTGIPLEPLVLSSVLMRLDREGLFAHGHSNVSLHPSLQTGSELDIKTLIGLEDPSKSYITMSGALQIAGIGLDSAVANVDSHGVTVQGGTSTGRRLSDACALKAVIPEQGQEPTDAAQMAAQNEGNSPWAYAAHWVEYGENPATIAAMSVRVEDGLRLVLSQPVGDREEADGVPGAQRGGEALGGGHQQAVADAVAERVVDHLEPVEVQEQHGDRADPRHGLLGDEVLAAVGQHERHRLAALQPDFATLARYRRADKTGRIELDPAAVREHDCPAAANRCRSPGAGCRSGRQTGASCISGMLHARCWRCPSSRANCCPSGARRCCSRGRSCRRRPVFDPTTSRQTAPSS